MWLLGFKSINQARHLASLINWSAWAIATLWFTTFIDGDLWLIRGPFDLSICHLAQQHKMVLVKLQLCVPWIGCQGTGLYLDSWQLHCNGWVRVGWFWALKSWVSQSECALCPGSFVLAFCPGSFPARRVPVVPVLVGIQSLAHCLTTCFVSYGVSVCILMWGVILNPRLNLFVREESSGSKLRVWGWSAWHVYHKHELLSDSPELTPHCFPCCIGPLPSHFRISFIRKDR